MTDIAPVIVQTEDDEWHGTDCFGVQIDINSGMWTENGDVTFVLYVKPDHADGHVTDDEWAQMVIRVPLATVLKNAPAEKIIEALRNNKEDN